MYKFVSALLFLSVSCSSAQVIEASNCKVFLEPLGLKNVSLFENEKTFLEQFDFFEIKSDSKIGNENIQYYSVRKSGNEIVSNSINGTVGFQENELVFFNLTVEFNSEFSNMEKILSLLKERDLDARNLFLYNSKNKYSARDKTQNCNRRIVFNKNKKGLIKMNIFMGRG